MVLSHGRLLRNDGSTKYKIERVSPVLTYSAHTMHLVGSTAPLSLSISLFEIHSLASSPSLKFFVESLYYVIIIKTARTIAEELDEGCDLFVSGIVTGRTF